MNKINSILAIILTFSLIVPAQAAKNKSKVLGLCKVGLYSSAAIFFGKCALDASKKTKISADLTNFYKKVVNKEVTKEELTSSFNTFKKLVLRKEKNPNFLTFMYGLACAKFATEAYNSLNKTLL